jgi:hypothetical protein
MRDRERTMQRNHRHRPLAFEQLESKAAPSSILLVLSADHTDATNAVSQPAELTPAYFVTDSLRVSNYRYETEQILRFISENTTGGEHASRPAALPTAAACAASDEMMRQIAVESTSLFVLGFCEVETEL